MKNLIFLFLITLMSCATDTQSQLTGKWMMHKVIQDKKDVTEEHNPHNERYFHMKDDGTFLSDGRPYGENRGKYIFNKVEKTLMIDSDAGADDDSNWKIIIKNNTMIWKGYGSEWAEGFEIHYIKG